MTGIAAEFPDVPHRYCDNHFLRDLAKPVLEADSHAKVQMRKKVRGLRTIEQAVLQRQEAEAPGRASRPTIRKPPCTATAAADDPPPAVADPAGAVVLDYCAAVRGILNDDQGGPLHPPGLRMAEALNEVRESIQRNLDAKKGGSRRSNSAAWPAASTGAWTKSRSSKRSIREYVAVIAEVAATLEPGTEDITRAAGEVRGVDRSLRGDRGSDPPRHGRR